jgi:nicotinamidase-related amidase
MLIFSQKGEAKMKETALPYQLRRQRLVQENGYNRWKIVEESVFLSSAATALLIVDMWDKHWAFGATARFAVLADRINTVANRAREKGLLIVHAPSDVMEFYAGQPGRERFLAGASANAQASARAAPDLISVADHPLPIDDSDDGSDTPELDRYPPGNKIVWTRQTEKIDIDQAKDLICGDEGGALFPQIRTRGIQNVLVAGVAVNMCVLNRSFGIKNLLAQGFKPVLVRDLTDAMYNPAMPPYVSHDEGARLVVEYIEKFYCPTIESGVILLQTP